MKTVRDEPLGTVLRQLETPEHRPDFHAELHRMLALERTARRLRRQRRPQVRWVARVAVAAVVVALAAFAFQALHSGESTIPPIVEEADAAVVKAKVLAARSGVRALAGDFVSIERDPTDTTDRARGEFVLLANGSFMVRTGRIEEAYDARRRTSTLYDPNPGFEPFAQRTRGLASGPPDAYVDSAFQRELGSVVRALLGMGDPRVATTRYAGRQVWSLSTPVRQDRFAGAGYSPDHLEVKVDVQTGIPLYARWTVDGELRRELRITRVELDPEVSRAELAVHVPADVPLSRSDQGFERFSLDEVEGAVGYAPLVPSWLPAGYELADVTVSPRGGPTGVEAMNPPGPDVVSLLYRRGFDRIVLSTRVAIPGDWSDPLATGEGFVDRPEQIRLERGALSGVEANLLIVPLATPHIWAQTDQLVVTVSGDLTRRELLRVAGSLEARG
jgi:hypothetical protein